MYLGRVLNSPRVIPNHDVIGNRLEHVFCLHYLYQNNISDSFGHRKKAECCKLKIFFYLIGGKCINGRKLEPFGEVCAGPPGQPSRWIYPK